MTDPTRPADQQPEPERFAVEVPVCRASGPPTLPFRLRERLRVDAVRRCRPA